MRITAKRAHVHEPRRARSCRPSSVFHDEEEHEDVRLHAVLALVPDRADREGERLRLGELDAGCR
jgi:hypothetical protein